MVYPFVINDTVGLQSKINLLFRKGKNGQTLYIADRTSEFIVRVVKIKRKTKADTLKAEIRATDKNANGYIIAKDILTEHGIDFDEKLTPKRQKPSRIFLKYNEGGVFVVSTISQTISVIMRSISGNQSLDLLISDRDPYFWKKTRQKT